MKISVLLALFFSFYCINATNYYCDPVDGSMSNDGSLSQPWSSLADVFTAQKMFNAGDTILLMAGPHGEAHINQINNNYVTIKTLNNEKAFISSIYIDDASYWNFENITITNDGSGGSFTKTYLFNSSATATYLKLNNCLFYSSTNSAAWDKQDWYDNTCNGLMIKGDHLTFTDNTITNIYHALEIRGNHASVSNNIIDNFAGDAIRALSSFSTYEDNTIRDAYVEDYNTNHDDAIQMYDPNNINNGVIESVTFSRNKIYNFADVITDEMINNDLVGYSMQGIIITDGSVSDIVVENNLVVSDHYHGITLVGANNCRIQNNTVIKTPYSINPETDATPWIQYSASKTNIECSNSIIRNNIASALTPWTYENGTNMITESNLSINEEEINIYFEGYTNLNFKLYEYSPAVDNGTNTDLAPNDILHQPRLNGERVDCGAYEYYKSVDEDSTSYINIISSIEDGFISDPLEVTTNNPYTNSISFGDKSGMKIGKSDAQGNSNTTSIIIPFQLPALLKESTLDNADFKIFVSYGRQWANNVNIDLYGLAYSNEATISSSDHYCGEFYLANNSDIGITDNFFSKNTSAGELDNERWESLNQTEQTSLKNYIQAQYNAGAQAGDYIFIRLSIDNKDMTGAHFFLIHGAEDSNQPTLSLSYKYSIPTVIEDETITSCYTFPSPITNNSITLSTSNNDYKEKLSFYDVSGQRVKQIVVNTTKETIHIANLKLKPGIYMMSIECSTHSMIQKIIVQ